MKLIHISTTIMTSPKKQHSAAIKAKVALEALLQSKTAAEISSEYGVHATQIGKWKKYLTEHVQELFSDKRRREQVDNGKLIEELYKQIGQQKVELDWMKKKGGGYWA